MRLLSRGIVDVGYGVLMMLTIYDGRMDVMDLHAGSVF